MAAHRYSKKPVIVEAEQFTGWGSAVSIMGWADGIYHVPAGYEHDLRHDHEHDHGNGNVYADQAPEFLVHKTATRIDLRDWVVRDADGVISRCAPDEFAAAYEEE